MRKIKINKIAKFVKTDDTFWRIKDDGDDECIFIENQCYIENEEEAEDFNKKIGDPFYDIDNEDNGLYIGNLEDKYDEKIFNLIKKIKSNQDEFYFKFLFKNEPTENQNRLLIKKINEFCKIIYKKQRLKFSIKNNGLYKIDITTKNVVKIMLKEQKNNKRGFYFQRAKIRSYIDFKKRELIKIRKIENEYINKK